MEKRIDAKKLIMRALLALLVLIMAVSAVSCKDSGNDGGSDDAANETEVTEDAGNQGDGSDASDGAAEDAGEDGAGSDSDAKSSTPGVDVDLTKLSSTAVYAEVSNMMQTPDNYKGKVVKMKGPFAVYTDENTKKNYFACVIKDATACCSQGLEFELKGDPKYPDDYPKKGTEITVVGEFDTYKEGKNTYSTLREAKML